MNKLLENNVDTRISLNRGLTSVINKLLGPGLCGKVRNCGFIYYFDSTAVMKNLFSYHSYDIMDLLVAFNCNQKKNIEA